MKLIYSPNLNHAYIVTEKQLAKLIYNCVGIYCCVVDCSSIGTSRSDAHCTIVFQSRLIIETTFLVQQSTFIACTFILFWQFVFVCYTMHSVVNSKEYSPSKVFLQIFLLVIKKRLFVCLFLWTPS